MTVGAQLVIVEVSVMSIVYVEGAGSAELATVLRTILKVVILDNVGVDPTAPSEVMLSNVTVFEAGPS